MGVGGNNAGELGLGDTTNRNFFVPIPSLNNLINLQFNTTKFKEDSSFFIQEFSGIISSGEIINGGLNNKSKGINLVAVIVVPIILIILILLVLFILLFIYLKKRKSKLDFTNSKLELIELNKKNIDINLNELIGESKRIYKGNYTGKEVALKKIINNNMNEYNFYE